MFPPETQHIKTTPLQLHYGEEEQLIAHHVLLSIKLNHGQLCHSVCLGTSGSCHVIIRKRLLKVMLLCKEEMDKLLLCTLTQLNFCV